MLPVRGIYKMKNGKFLVKKYGCHIGVYSTYEEAHFQAREAEKYKMDNK